MTSRHGSRIGLGGTVESEDSDAASGDDSDTEATGAAAGALAMQGRAAEYISSTYFSNQLYAFEVWLQHAATAVSQFLAGRGADQMPRSLSTQAPPGLAAPNELPAVLQVLLSQQYRVRALILLYRFMNLGPWAVDLAMAVGIYPYMSKLLASTTAEFREVLILVWARLSAVDMRLHPELLKCDQFEYFVTYLASNVHMQYEPVSDKGRLCDTVCAASAFTLAMLCRGTRDAQKACFDGRVLDYFLLYLRRPDNGTDERACLRTWILLCLAELWKDHSDAKWMAMTYKLCVITSRRHAQAQEQPAAEHVPEPSFAEQIAASASDASVEDRDAQDLLVQMAFHRAPTVRAAAIYAAGTLLHGLAGLGSDPAVLFIVRKTEAQLLPLLMQAALDGSPMVRREVAQTIAHAVFASYMPQAVEAVARVVAEELRSGGGQQPHTQASDDGADVSLDLLTKLYKTLLRLSVDPHPDVALVAREACDVLMQCYAHSRAFFDAEAQLDQALHRLEISRAAKGQQPILGFLRTAGSVGDALLGFPPSSGGSPSASSSVLGDDALPSGRATGVQHTQAQRRLSAHVGHRGAPGAHKLNGSGLAQGSVPSHRYTMHASQQHQHQHQQHIHVPSRSHGQPAASESVSAASMRALDAAPGDRFGSMSDADERLARVEAAWLEWGRGELQAGVCESTLVDWAGAHFTEFDISLFASVSGTLQSSAELVESRERNRRVDRMEASARAMSSAAGTMKWADATTVGTVAAPASAALLHPLEPHAIIATRRGTVAVFDWEMHAQVAQYSIAPVHDNTAAPAPAADACALHLINPLGQAKLLVGTADGMVRVFASHAPDFAPPPPGHAPVFPRPRLLTAFAALPWAAPPPPMAAGLAPTTLASSSARLRSHLQQNPLADGPSLAPSAVAGCQLVTAWNQRSGVLFAGGNDKEIRVWDVASELCVEEISVSSMGGITCVSHDGVSGNLFAVGNVDGVVRVVDRRLDARSGVVANWREHSPHAIRNVAMRPGQIEVVSASAAGDVKYWDLRHRSATFTLVDTHTNRRLEHMLAHESAPVTLTASDATVKLWNQRGTNIGVVTASKHVYGSAASYMKSLAGYGARPQAVHVSAVAMHTYLPVALMVSDDGRVSCIQPRKAGPNEQQGQGQQMAAHVLQQQHQQGQLSVGHQQQSHLARQRPRSLLATARANSVL
ncbi:Target of rapamycin complex 1 subunit kog1 [Coemansia sp. RSA 2603]|nr:Target of rapamycin complex 1 subunit kog1 [Coemansia sp. RSA 2603]